MTSSLRRRVSHLFALGLLVLLACACGEDQAGRRETPQRATIRRPALGGIVFRDTPDAVQKIRQNPKNGELRIIGASLETQVGVAYDAHPRDVRIAFPYNHKRRFHAIVRPRDKTIASARRMLAERIEQVLNVRIEERSRERQVLILRPAMATLPLRPSQAGESSFKAKLGEFRMVRQPISKLISLLRDGTEKPIIDETGLESEYDFLLQWDPAAGSYALIQALRDLGLELESAKRVFAEVVVTKSSHLARVEPTRTPVP